MRKSDVMDVWRSLDDIISTLHTQLAHGTYRHGSYKQFYIHDPKRRHISKATVRDRLVHQAIVQVIESAFERSFIHDSYASRKKKGTHAMRKRMYQMLRSASQNNTRTLWILKCDISKFFDSIRHDILLQTLSRGIAEKRCLDLLVVVVNSFASERSGRGIPLGNVTGQLFANVYMNSFDHFVKEQLRMRWYTRFCDDFFLLHPSRAALVKALSAIRVFLSERLLLTLHPRKVFIRTWAQGIDVLGIIMRPHALTLRGVTQRRMMHHLCDRIESYIHDQSQDDTMRGVLDSYRGLISRGNHHDVRFVLEQCTRDKILLPDGHEKISY